MNKYQYKVQGVDYDVEIEEVVGNVAKVSVNGIPFEVEMKQPINAAHHTHPVHHAPVTPPKPQAAPAVKPAATVAPQPASTPTTGAGTPLKAPLPGTITSVNVNVGDAVNAGDTVVVLEAMKMQNNIEAENSGTVKQILVKQGDAVLEGATLVVIG